MFSDKIIQKLLFNIIIEILERDEDRYFSVLAEELDIEGLKRISHKDAWK